MFRRTWQSPSNAHAYRLYVVNEPLQEHPALRLAFLPTPLRSAKPSIMTDFEEACQPLRSADLLTQALQPWLAMSAKTHILARFSRSHQHSPTAPGCASPDENAPSLPTGRLEYQPDDVLLSHGNPHYHRRRGVSLSCSGWEGVGPPRYGHQA